MVIDLICDRMGGMPYKARDFYFDCLCYGRVADGITRAMDYGTEQDVARELCAYIDNNEYNPAIKEYVSSVLWLEDDKHESAFYFPGEFWPDEFDERYDEATADCGGWDDEGKAYTTRKLIDKNGTRHLIYEYDKYLIDNTKDGQRYITDTEYLKMLN